MPESAKGLASLSTTELCVALRSADQIVNLKVRLRDSPETVVLVEDGDLFSMAISSARA
jgi:hypothetical protein